MLAILDGTKRKRRTGGGGLGRHERRRALSTPIEAGGVRGSRSRWSVGAGGTVKAGCMGIGLSERDTICVRLDSHDSHGIVPARVSIATRHARFRCSVGMGLVRLVLGVVAEQFVKLELKSRTANAHVA